MHNINVYEGFRGLFIMKKALVLGAFQFLGFHLCSKLLIDGEEMIGIPLPNLQVEYVDEKRMEIGRNANFIEQDWNDLEQLFQCEEIDTIYIDLYTLKMAKDLFSQIQQKIVDNENLLKNKQIVLLTNISFLKEKEGTIFEQTSMFDRNITVMYFPTLYGPWQPNDFLFQQVIEEKRQVKLNSLEYPFDAIFVEDVVKEVVTHVKSSTSKHILFKSTIPEHWQICVNLLNWEEKMPIIEQRDIGSNIEKRFVKASNNVKHNLEIQKKHYQLVSINSNDL